LNITPVVKLPKARWELNDPKNADWTKYVYDQLDVFGKDMLKVVPKDYKDFCPQFLVMSPAQKKGFYVMLISGMVERESGHDTQNSYQENFKDNKGHYIVSRGLLQISIESGNAYGCGFEHESELHIPEKNLSCGIRILNRWISRDGRLAGKIDGRWRGGARYWSVLRSSSKPKIMAWTKEYCAGVK